MQKFSLLIGSSQDAAYLLRGQLDDGVSSESTANPEALNRSSVGLRLMSASVVTRNGWQTR